MKKFVLAAAGSLLFVTAASAADMAPRYTKAPVVAPVYNWGGLYLGINGGGGSAHTCWDIFNDSGFPIVPSVPEGCHNATGATVGGQIGYRWQATNWVFGLEAQGNWADFRGSNASQYAVFGTTSLLNDVTKVDAFGLFTGQVGYAFNNVLLYAKGGAAVVHDKYSLTVTPAGAAALAPFFAVVAGQTGAVGSETRWGGTVGAGIEFGFAPGWSVAVEYDHLFMGSRDVTTNTIAPFAAPPSTHRISQDIDIGTVRVNYTFGGPVVAKY
ncbi:outer membrane protein [Bradyrhizobium sp. 482_C4_N1_1]|jgi:outer membrane immunogenic protein|uniref:outer membrane protein n=1 Tax=unclassified Bradyrhizobium TaxID=2631580 RepID=UPI003F8BC4F0